MTTQDKSTSGEVGQPVHVSSASSLDSFFLAGVADGTANGPQIPSPPNTVPNTAALATGISNSLRLQHPGENVVSQSSTAIAPRTGIISPAHRSQQMPVSITTAQPPPQLPTAPTSSSATLRPNATSTSSIAATTQNLQIVPLVLPHLSLPASQLATLAPAPVLAPSYATPGGASLTLQGMAIGGNQAPEFLYQLTKMLTDNNRDIIEWTNGRIEVHNPHKLEELVLHKYFRHSKFASFQRQLNYFGFRKQAGKGKMAPCSYVNESVSGDISGLLHIKRKTSVSMSAKEKEKLARKKENAAQNDASAGGGAGSVNPVLAGILYRTNTQTPSGTTQKVENEQPEQVPTIAPGVESRNPASTSAPTAPIGIPNSNAPGTAAQGQSYHAVARAAVGRGIRHGYATTARLSSRPSLRDCRFTPPTIPSAPAPVTTAAQINSTALSNEISQAVLPTASTATADNDSNRMIQGFEDNLSKLMNNYQQTLSQQTCTTAITATAAVGQQTVPSQDVEVVSEALLQDAEPTPLDLLVNLPSESIDEELMNTDDSLVALAMIPLVEEGEGSAGVHTNNVRSEFSFIDFPDPDLDPSKKAS